jgi:hypothetical protein
MGKNKGSILPVLPTVFYQGDMLMCDQDNEVQDGAIDEESYNKAKYKIVHLLKEPTEKNKSIAESIKKHAIKGEEVLRIIWRVTARRSHCILNEFPVWEKVVDKKHKFANDLRSSAVVNLSLSVGARSTDTGKVSKMAEENKERWYKQLNKLQPKIIICGGTFWEAIKQLKGYKEKNVPRIETGMDYYPYKDENLNTVFLNCYHPSHRKNHAMEYCSFRESVKSIMEKLKM